MRHLFKVHHGADMSRLPRTDASLLRGPVALSTRSFFFIATTSTCECSVSQTERMPNVIARFGGELLDPKERPKWPGSRK
jgi:hypothetical protein